MASIAILIGSLAPAISHALQAGNPTAWAEICTTLGSKRIQTPDGVASQQDPAAPTDHLLQHCPYCALHVTALEMLPTPLAVPALIPVSFGVPELFLITPRTLFAWATAQPRGPPRIS